MKNRITTLPTGRLMDLGYLPKAQLIEEARQLSAFEHLSDAEVAEMTKAQLIEELRTVHAQVDNLLEGKALARNTVRFPGDVDQYFGLTGRNARGKAYEMRLPL